MISRVRESLTLVLLFALPFHAFLVTVFTKIIAGPGHAPLTVLALWKEAVLGVILVIALIEIAKRVQSTGLQSTELRLDRIDSVIAFLFILSILVSILGHGDPMLYAYGFKYVFVALGAFVILRRVTWSAHFASKALYLILLAAAIIAGYGLLTLILPMSFFTFLGYSDLHSLYLPDAPLPAFHQIGGTMLRRMQSTMSGPNQLGLYLLLPWICGFSYWLKRPSLRNASLPFVFGFAIIFTFSRTAWIAAAFITIVYLIMQKRWRESMGALSLMVVTGLIVAYFFPSVILRFASSEDHLSRPLEAVQRMIEHPLGEGLGAAGPASNRVSDACVHLEEGSDASWAADRTDLCVFVNDEQIQPVDRACTCPFLPENWYLQLGVEMGWLGMGAFLLLVSLVTHALIKKRDQSQILLFAFLGVAMAGLFLHSFEDGAVAYTLWLLLAVSLPSFRRDAIG